ncbi:MAG: hypothetical protein OEY20_16160 [Gemmatimonadota bacterium]|jgi:hypothetical protein|nr:hypothetical protein [Gemmatimonadota bacterium]MDH5198776.1 hypothetical protein [Gemmatimonadota bacterium]
MTLHQPVMQQHRLPWGLELVGAAIIGAALLLGGLLIAGHTDILPWNAATPVDMEQVYEMLPPRVMVPDVVR